MSSPLAGVILPEVNSAARRREVEMPPLPIGQVMQAPPEAVWTYAIARIDRSGRLSDQSIIETLGWTASDTLSLSTTGSGTGVFRRTTDGWYRLTRRREIHLPAPMRARCGINRGDRLLLAAQQAADTLVVYTMPELERLLSSGHQDAIRGGQG